MNMLVDEPIQISDTIDLIEVDHDTCFAFRDGHWVVLREFLRRKVDEHGEVVQDIVRGMEEVN